MEGYSDLTNPCSYPPYYLQDDTGNLERLATNCRDGMVRDVMEQFSSERINE